MKIILAGSAGFCMGVKRAIAMAHRAAENSEGTVYTYGPLIHNPQELQRLAAERIVPMEETPPEPNSSVIIRAHGVTPDTLEKLRKDGLEVLDATCPKVSSIQERIREYSLNGYAVVISGDPDHPEVMGLLGFATGPAFVVETVEDVDRLPVSGKVLLVSQTTQDELKYEEVRERFLARFPDGCALSTICSSTHMRQSDVRRMVREVEAMVIIGGRNSGNTKRLHAISAEAGLPAFQVETADELPLDQLRGLSTVGVTAGASTPEWIIRDVVKVLEAL